MTVPTQRAKGYAWTYLLSPAGSPPLTLSVMFSVKIHMPQYLLIDTGNSIHRGNSFLNGKHSHRVQRLKTKQLQVLPFPSSLEDLFLPGDNHCSVFFDYFQGLLLAFCTYVATCHINSLFCPLTFDVVIKCFLKISNYIDIILHYIDTKRYILIYMTSLAIQVISNSLLLKIGKISFIPLIFQFSLSIVVGLLFFLARP